MLMVVIVVLLFNYEFIIYYSYIMQLNVNICGGYLCNVLIIGQLVIFSKCQ